MLDRLNTSGLLFAFMGFGFLFESLVKFILICIVVYGDTSRNCK